MTQAAVTALAYVVLDSGDLDAWEQFGAVLGMESARDASSLSLRMDERSQRIVVRRAPEDGLAAVGWDVADGAELERARTVLEDAGFDVRDATADELELRAIDSMIWTRDPDDNRVELAVGARLAADARAPTSVSGFVTGDLGMGHVVLMTKDQAAMQSFYEHVFGFRVTDVVGDFMMFLRCNRRHHSLGLINAGVPGVNHLMVEVATVDDVGAALDAVRATGNVPAVELGRHSNDDVFSFYAWSPSGFMVECGTAGRLVEPDAKPGQAGADLWGHQGLIEAHTNLIQRAREAHAQSLRTAP